MQTLITSLILIASFTSIVAQHAIKVAGISMTVSNLDRAVEFYTNTLGFTHLGGYVIEGSVSSKLFNLPGNTHQVRISRLSLGDEQIELMEFSDGQKGREIPADSRSNDKWFQHIAIVVSNMDSAYAQLRKAQVTHVSTSPQTLPQSIPAAAGISAFYFRDPDGHNLEIIHFPKGKGDPRWQDVASGELFLGIDHTAIGIEDTDAGIGFYTTGLGLATGGNSENYGMEQEHLNQVFGARLLITGLHANSGIGIEFLDYIAPPGGRDYPSDSTPADLWHWHTTIVVDDIDKALTSISKTGSTVVSRHVVEIAGERFILVRDKDNHAVMLRETSETPRSM